MAFETTRQQLLQQAALLDRKYGKSGNQEFRDEAIRLRRIVTELEAFTGAASGVSQIIPGTNISVSPAGGTGAVTINATGGGGGSQNLQQVTDIGTTTTNAINVGGITTDYVQLDTLATPTLQPGMFGWNDAYGTADLRLKGNNVTLQLGQEILARVVNKTGANLLESEYKVVRVRIASEGGAQGQRLAVVLAQGNNDPDSVTTLGIVTENIADNQEGFITILGNVNNINTTGSLQGETWVDGDVLYLSPTTPGALTKVKPTAPDHTVTIGYVVYAHANQGKIFVKVDNGYELDELHNVLITTPSSGQLLRYNGTVWENWTPNYLTSVPTLAQVTSAGNTTTNAITVGGLVVDTNTLVVDSVNDRVGIGTTTPTHKLSVAGDMFFSGHALLNNNLPSRHTQTVGFKAFWPGANSSFMASTGSGYEGWTLNANLVRDTSLFWVHQDTARSAWHMFALYGSASDSFGIERSNATSGTATLTRLFTIFGTGNVAIGTTTDSGYKLDVNGTARIQGSVTNTSGGFIANLSSPTSDAFYTIVGGNIGFYTSNAHTKAQRLNLTNTTGVPSAPNNVLSVSGSITASSALAAGVFFNNTLVATANNDVLVGLDINPTFTNGAFTGVNNYGLRVKGDDVNGSSAYSLYAYGGQALIKGNFSISAGYNFTVQNRSDVNHLRVRGDGVTILESLAVSDGGNKGFTVSYSGAGGYQFGLAVTDTGVAFTNGAAASRPVSFSMNTGEILRIHQNYTAIVTNNFLVGTTTDAGFKLDVNGSFRASASGNVLEFRSNGFTYASRIYLLNDFLYNSSSQASLGIGNRMRMESNTGIDFSWGNLVQGGFVFSTTQSTNNSVASPKQSFVVTHTLNDGASSSLTAFRSVVIADVMNMTTFPLSTYHALYINPTIAAGTTNVIAIQTVSGKVIHQGLTNATHANAVYYNTATGELTYGAAGGGTTPTLAQVTTAGNTTANAISTGKITATDTGLSGTTRPFNAIATGANTYVAVAALYAPNTNVAGRYAIFTYGTESATGNSAELRFYYAGSNNSGSRLEFAFNGYANPALSATVGGNVLIGTTTDAGYKLDVNGNTFIRGNLHMSDAGNRYIYAINGNYINLYNGGTGGLDFYALNGTAESRFFGALRVTGNLVTQGSFSMNGNLDIGSNNYVGAVSNGIRLYRGFDASMQFYLGHPTVGDFLWDYPAGTTIMTLKRGGNLLIGTTTDTGYKLNVNGSFISNGDTLVTTANGRIAGFTGLGSGQTVHLQYGGDSNHRISTPYGAGVTFDAYHGVTIRTNGASTGKALIVNQRNSAHYIQEWQDNGTTRAFIDSGGNLFLSPLNSSGDGFVTATGGILNTISYGYTGIITFPTNPPGQQNLNFQDGILVNVF